MLALCTDRRITLTERSPSWYESKKTDRNWTSALHFGLSCNCVCSFCICLLSCQISSWDICALSMYCASYYHSHVHMMLYCTGSSAGWYLKLAHFWWTKTAEGSFSPTVFYGYLYFLCDHHRLEKDCDPRPYIECSDTKQFVYISRRFQWRNCVVTRHKKRLPFHSWKRKKFPDVGIADVIGSVSNDLTTRPMVENSRVTPLLCTVGTAERGPAGRGSPISSCFN